MPLEYGSQALFPGSRVSLFVRFDEFGVKTSDTKKIEKLKPITQIKGTNDTRGALKVVPDPSSPSGVTKFLLLPPGATASDSAVEDVGPFADDESEDGMTHRLLAIIPKKADWKQNGLRTADTLTLEFRWMDLPIDPRVIRSCAVKFYLGTLSATEFSAGIMGQVHEKGSRHRPMSILPDTFVDAVGNERSNLRFLGWVDKWEMVWDENEPIIRMECTDNTRLLLKQPQPAQGKVDGKKPIDEAIADYLAQFPQLGGLTVEYRPATLPRDDIPSLDKLLANTAKVPDLGPPAKGSGDGEDDSVWDYLDVVTGAIGHMIRVDGTSIIIQQAHSLLDGRALPREGDRYVPRRLPSGLYEIRTFIWGRNISELKVSHAYTRAEAKGIEARCYSSARKKTLVARFPAEGDRPTHPLPGAKGDAHWQVIRVQGLESETQLKQVAENYYNNVFRNELGVSIKTRNLSSFGGDGRDPDLLDMRAGDNFEVRVAQGENESVQGIFEADDPNALVDRLTGIGYTSAFANAYAITYLNAGFQKIYRAREIGVTWDVDDGIHVEISGHNYVEARVDKPNNSGGTATFTGRK